jgi:hypothetical protein
MKALLIIPFWIIQEALPSGSKDLLTKEDRHVLAYVTIYGSIIQNESSKPTLLHVYLRCGMSQWRFHYQNYPALRLFFIQFACHSLAIEGVPGVFYEISSGASCQR